MKCDELFWNMCEEHYEHARAHEDQRASMTNIVVAVAVGISALLATDLMKDSVLPGWFLIGLGLFGALLSYKHYERFRLHVINALVLRLEIEFPTDPPPTLRALREIAEDEHKNSSLWWSEKRVEENLLRFYPESARSLDAAKRVVRSPVKAGGPKENEEPRPRHRLISRVRLGMFYIGLNLSIAVLGMRLLVAHYLR